MALDLGKLTSLGQNDAETNYASYFNVHWHSFCLNILSEFRSICSDFVQVRLGPFGLVLNLCISDMIYLKLLGDKAQVYLLRMNFKKKQGVAVLINELNGAQKVTDMVKF